MNFRLDGHSGVPVYRQIIDQLLGAIATVSLQLRKQSLRYATTAIQEYLTQFRYRSL